MSAAFQTRNLAAAFQRMLIQLNPVRVMDKLS